MSDSFETEEIQYKPVQDVPFSMMFWQFILGTIGAAVLTGLLTYMWLLIQGVDSSCGLASAADDGSIFSGLGGFADCLDVIGGWPEIILGNLGMLLGSTITVYVIGHLGGARRPLLLVLIIPVAVLILVQILFPKELILLRGLMIDLVRLDLDWELIRATALMGLAATASYFFVRGKLTDHSVA